MDNDGFGYPDRTRFQMSRRIPLNVPVFGQIPRRGGPSCVILRVVAYSCWCGRYYRPERPSHIFHKRRLLRRVLLRVDCLVNPRTQKSLIWNILSCGDILDCANILNLFPWARNMFRRTCPTPKLPNVYPTNMFSRTSLVLLNCVLQNLKTSKPALQTGFRCSHLQDLPPSLRAR